MIYCSNCGKEVNENQAACLYCGASTKQISIVNDNGGFLWGLLGFFVPVAGLVLYLVWNDQKPKTAKAAGIGAIVGVVMGVVLYILFMILYFYLISEIFPLDYYIVLSK